MAVIYRGRRLPAAFGSFVSFGVWRKLQLQNMAAPYFDTFGVWPRQPTTFGPRGTRGLLVARRDRYASWSCTSSSHPHAHLHAQLGLISASVYAVYAVYAISSLDTGVPLRPHPKATIVGTYQGVAGLAPRPFTLEEETGSHAYQASFPLHFDSLLVSRLVATL